MNILSLINGFSVVVMFILLLAGLIILVTAQNKESYMKLLMAHVGVRIFILISNLIPFILSRFISYNQFITRMINIGYLLLFLVSLVILGIGIYMAYKKDKKTKGLLPLFIYLICGIIAEMYILVTGRVFQSIIARFSMNPVVVLTFLNSLKLIGDVISLIIMLIGCALIGKAKVQE